MPQAGQAAKAHHPAEFHIGSSWETGVCGKRTDSCRKGANEKNRMRADKRNAGQEQKLTSGLRTPAARLAGCARITVSQKLRFGFDRPSAITF